MSLPALIRTWSARRDIPALDTSTLPLISFSGALALKRSMTGAEATGSLGGTRHANSLWTVVRSSNGVTADATDRWTNLAAIVGNTNGNAHSWIVLQNATLGYQVLLDVNGTMTGGLSWRMCATKIAAPFSASVSTTSAPISAGEFNLGVVAGGLGSISPSLFGGTTGGTNLFHYITADDGQFIFMMNRLSGGGMSGFVALLKTENNAVADTCNVFFLMHGVSESARGVPQASTLASAPNVTGRNADDFGTGFSPGGVRSLNFGNTSWGALVTAKTDLNRGFPAFKIEIADGTIGHSAHRGNLVDVHFVSIDENKVCAVYPDAVTPTHLFVGDIAVPWAGAAPTT